MFRYRAKERSRTVQIYAGVSLLLFAILMVAGLTLAAWAVAILSFAIYVNGRLSA